MWIPFISTRSSETTFTSSSRKSRKSLSPRAGGGGRGSGGGGGGRGGGGGSSKGGGSSGPKGGGSSGPKSGGSGPGSSGGNNPRPISSGGTTKSASSYGPGGGKQTTIPSGSSFAGRTVGGGTRDQVFGNKQYGSGYPGVATRGVGGRGFPFVFWPLAWGGLAGAGAGAYLHNSEYGRPDNSSRPGGPLATTTFTSNSTNSTFRVLADNTTITALIDDIQTNCSVKATNNSSPVPYQDSTSALPQPEQTIQYYRASSVALTLDGYNNSAVFQPEGAADTPLPSNIDTNLLNCLNYTIGTAVPLVGGSSYSAVVRNEVLLFMWVLWLFGYFV